MDELGLGVAVERGELYALKHFVGHANGFLAVFAHALEQALGGGEADGGLGEEGLDAHVGQTGEDAGGVVGVQGAQDEVAGERRFDGDVGGLVVADLADHDDVGILAQDLA